MIASDGSQTTSPSADSNPVVVDRTLPNAPSFSPNPSKGSKSVSVTVADKVGNTKTITCAYKIGKGPRTLALPSPAQGDGSAFE